MFKALIVIAALVILVANFPKQSVNVGTKVVTTAVSLASGSYQIGKTAINETRNQVTEKVNTK